MSLRALPLQPVLETSTHDLVRGFYVPALAHAKAYDRGVGYFTSEWLRLAASGLAALAENGGSARFIASPIMSSDDWAALSQGTDARNDPRLLAALQRTLDDLAHALETDTFAALAWMVADGLLDFRIAVPSGDLDGDFHDKFGVFRDSAGDAVAFHGSANDSARAFRNYESIDVFYSWADERDAARVALHQSRFERLWDNRDANLRVYELPDAIRRNLVQFTTHAERPYGVPGQRRVREPRPDRPDEKWRHQRDALAAFLNAKHGILEMATGTGKTRTALAILNELHTRGLVQSAIITAFGTDLLDQWYRELVKYSPFLIYRAYGTNREALAYLNNPRGGLLLASRQALAEALPLVPPGVFAEALLVADEVHGLASPALVAALGGRLKPFRYRLGLSATPEREYDGDGNAFIADEIGPVVFRFSLKDAIERGILCEFDYVPLEYVFSDDDRAAVRGAIALYHAKRKHGEAPPIETLYQEIARIRKLSRNKLPPFREYLLARADLMRRSLMFVETAEYGMLVQEILMEVSGNFHTYYAEDDRANLSRFASGELECLVTCHRISEGIDIRSVNNIVLFASARARIETIQRLGRCLRVDPTNPAKRATVIDFIRIDDVDPDSLADPTADIERRAWFEDLAATRRAIVLAPHPTR